MPDKVWKVHERNVAKKLGGQRTPLSSGSSLHTSGDVIHDIFYVECKYRRKFASVSLHEKTKNIAKNENPDKIPITVLKQKRKHGELVLIELDDFLKILPDAIIKPKKRKEE